MATHPESHDDHTRDDIARTVQVIASNYATKEELAILNGKVDVLSTKLDTIPIQIELAFTKLELGMKTYMEQAFKAHTEIMYKTFATKAELSDAVYQLTWRMAGFGALLLSAGFAFARYL